jgi:hypothetical protein
MLIMLPLWSMGQNVSLSGVEDVFTYENGQIKTKEKFINTIPVLNRDDLTPYKLNKSFDVYTTDKNKYIVKFLRYNGWETEAGDADIIRVYNAPNSMIFELKDDGNSSWSCRQFQYDSIDGCFFEIPLQEDAKALLFLGHTYASDPQAITIVVLHQNTATLVFNKMFYLNDISLKDHSIFISEKIDESYSVQAVIPEDNNKYKIYPKDGVLKIEQIGGRKKIYAPEK